MNPQVATGTLSGAGRWSGRRFAASLVGSVCLVSDGLDFLAHDAPVGPRVLRLVPSVAGGRVGGGAAAGAAIGGIVGVYIQRLYVRSMLVIKAGWTSVAARRTLRL